MMNKGEIKMNRYAVNTKTKEVFPIDEGFNCIIAAENIFDPEEADQRVLEICGANTIVEAPDRETALEKALKQSDKA
jgi:hypothetical protein